MRRTLRGATFIVFMLISLSANSQVVISLLFGEKLNSEKIEFGLVGGVNWSTLAEIESSKALANFNLGFYFHFMIAENSFLSTGVLVKSDLGAAGMPTYAIGDPDFDSVFVNGEQTKKISYFHVPVLYQYRIKNRVYFEAGVQAGLRFSATDTFQKSGFGGDVQYIRNVREDYDVLDFGLSGGFGYKFKQKTKSMSMGLRYYHGLVNVSTIEGESIKNASLYLFFKIPIGVGKEQANGEAN